MVHAHDFIAESRRIDGKQPGRRGRVSDSEIHQFKAKYGISPGVCVVVHRKLRRKVRHEVSVRHFLWAMSLLKTYDTEDVLAGRFGASPKTIRKHVWPTIKKIASLSGHVVSYRACMVYQPRWY